jgi:hypothetical protein
MSSPVQESGYRFGPGNWKPKGELTKEGPRYVDGISAAATGYELLAGDGVSLSWYACVLDAYDALRAHSGPGKVVRCADRALLRIRHPRGAK